MLKPTERTVLWLVWGILHVEKAGEYRKFYGLMAVVETFAIISEVVTSPSLLSTKVNLYLPDQLGHISIPPGQLTNMNGSLQHRDKPGRLFRPLRSCQYTQYPLHNGPNRKCHRRDVISIKISEECLKLYGSLLQRWCGITI